MALDELRGETRILQGLRYEDEYWLRNTLLRLTENYDQIPTGGQTRHLLVNSVP